MRNRRNKKPLYSGLTVGVRTQLCKECQDMQTRLCEVEGEPAFFHRWVEEDRPLLQFNALVKEYDAIMTRQKFDQLGVCPSNARIEKARQTFALVEMLDGRAKKVAPEKVRFCDREEAKG